MVELPLSAAPHRAAGEPQDRGEVLAAVRGRRRAHAHERNFESRMASMASLVTETRPDRPRRASVPGCPLRESATCDCGSGRASRDRRRRQSPGGRHARGTPATPHRHTLPKMLMRRQMRDAGQAQRSLFAPELTRVRRARISSKHFRFFPSSDSTRRQAGSSRSGLRLRATWRGRPAFRYQQRIELRRKRKHVIRRQ